MLIENQVQNLNQILEIVFIVQMNLGQGVLLMKDGSRYEGEFENGEITGKGERHYADGTVPCVAASIRHWPHMNLTLHLNHSFVGGAFVGMPLIRRP